MILAAFLSTLLPTPTGQTPSWRYSRFLNALENQTVEQVTLNQNWSIALIETKDGKTIGVSLPEDPDLKELLLESNARIAISETALNSPSETGLSISPMVAVITYFLVGSIIWLWMLIDCAMQEAPQGNTKIAWILIIIFTAWMGAFVYLLFRRPQRKQELGR